MKNNVLKVAKISTIVFLSIIMLFALSSKDVMAGTVVTQQSADSSGHTFYDDWNDITTKYLAYGQYLRLEYGYNTWFINEDMAYAYSDSNMHRSAISNGNGFFVGPWVTAREYSDLEVRHKGSFVRYYNQKLI